MHRCHCGRSRPLGTLYENKNEIDQGVRTPAQAGRYEGRRQAAFSGTETVDGVTRLYWRTWCLIDFCSGQRRLYRDTEGSGQGGRTVSTG